MSDVVGAHAREVWEILTCAVMGSTRSVSPIIMSKPFGIGDMVKNIRLSDIIGVGLFPLALSFLMPMFMTAIALEKQEKLREMMEMVTVPPSAPCLRRPHNWIHLWGSHLGLLFAPHLPLLPPHFVIVLLCSSMCRWA